MSPAVFDINDHAIAAGWATYQGHEPTHEHIAAEPPEPANGHSPSNYARCACGAWFKWFVVGQHRFGSLSRQAEKETAPARLEPEGERDA